MQDLHIHIAGASSASGRNHERTIALDSPCATYPLRVRFGGRLVSGAADHEIVFFSAISAPFGLKIAFSHAPFGTAAMGQHRRRSGAP